MRKNISGKNIKKYRNKLKMTQAELARRMSVAGRITTQRHIHNMELGICRVTDLDLAVLADIFCTTFSELLQDG